MVHIVVFLYTFQLENHILLYLHYVFVLEIQQQFCSNTAYLVLYLVKETCNVVVDRRVSSLLVIVINVCISPSY